MTYSQFGLQTNPYSGNVQNEFDMEILFKD